MKKNVPSAILAGVLSSCLLTITCSRSGSEGASATPRRTQPTSPVLAQEARLFMAGTDMRLGMPQEPLLAKLKANYTLGAAGTNGWAIFEKNGPPFKFVGIIGFTDGKLASISKDWGSYSGVGAIGLGKELFSLLSSLSDRGPTPVIVDPKVSVRQPGIVVSVIQLFYPDRTVSISIVESKENGDSLSMSEEMKAK